MPKLKTSILAFLFILASCNRDGRNTFSLSIKHYASAAGITIIYSLTEDNLQIDTNCDLENCKQITVYKTSFTRLQSDSIYNFLLSLRLDTLKPQYKTDRMFDGLVTRLKFTKNIFTSYTSIFNNYSTSTTDTLFKYIDNLISQKKYRFATWGDD